MSKRKTVGGYTFSDDEQDTPAPTPPPQKKSKPYAPMTLSAKPFKSNRADTHRAASSTTFARVAANASATNAQPVAPGAQRLAPPTPRETPNPPASSIRHIPLSVSDSEEENSTNAISSPVEATRTKRKPSVSNSLVTAPAGPLQRHLPLALERELDDLRITVTTVGSKLELAENTIKSQGQELGELRTTVTQMNATLIALTATVEARNATIATLQANANAPTTGAAPSASPAADILTPVILILPPTTNHLSRSAMDKPIIPERNQLMELLRGAVWDSLDGVEKASGIKPPVFDHAGKHVLFPIEFADAQGHVKAYPDWNAKITTQVPFVSMVLEAFRAYTMSD